MNSKIYTGDNGYIKITDVSVNISENPKTLKDSIREIQKRFRFESDKSEMYTIINNLIENWND